MLHLEISIHPLLTPYGVYVGVKVYVNDILSSEGVPDLYTKEEQVDISDSLIEAVKAKGVDPEPSACWDFFVQQVPGDWPGWTIRLLYHHRYTVSHPCLNGITAIGSS